LSRQGNGLPDDEPRIVLVTDPHERELQGGGKSRSGGLLVVWSLYGLTTKSSPNKAVVYSNGVGFGYGCGCEIELEVFPRGTLADYERWHQNKPSLVPIRGLGETHIEVSREAYPGTPIRSGTGGDEVVVLPSVKGERYLEDHLTKKTLPRLGVDPRDMRPTVAHIKKLLSDGEAGAREVAARRAARRH
jgi:hypothetical protein